MRQWNHPQKHCRSIEQQNSVSGFLSVHNRFFLWIKHPGISSHDVVFPIGVWIVVKISFRSLDRPLKIERWSACILSSCWCLRSEVLFLQEALGTFMIIRTVKGIQRRDGGTLCKMHLGAPLLILWNSLVLLSNISKSRNICFHPSVASLFGQDAAISGFDSKRIFWENLSLEFPHFDKTRFRRWSPILTALFKKRLKSAQWLEVPHQQIVWWHHVIADNICCMKLIFLALIRPIPQDQYTETS